MVASYTLFFLFSLSLIYSIASKIGLIDLAGLVNLTMDRVWVDLVVVMRHQSLVVRRGFLSSSSLV